MCFFVIQMRVLDASGGNFVTGLSLMQQNRPFVGVGAKRFIQGLVVTIHQ
jgi:hypothetical protein